MKTIALLLGATLALAARADEGMWTFNGFPAEAVREKHGFAPDARWLERARLASARLAQGCSASFVSATGLVMTNHHCAQKCIEQLSSGTRDLVRDGFLARSEADELRCPELEVNQLLEITDVTARLRQATRGLTGPAFGEAQRSETARIERECQTTPALRCDVVALHRGGRHDLYRYRRLQDVRLVFAPEFAIAFFGGDPDNFMFPRYDLDVAFLRVYEGGKPAATPTHFGFSAGSPREGDLVFVAGHPGITSRRKTVAQLAYERDTALPESLLRLAWLRGLLTEYRHRGPEQARHASAELFSVENSLKARKGRLEALLDPAFFGARVAEENRLRADLARGPEAVRSALPAFDAIARTAEVERRIRVRLVALEGEGEMLDRPARIRPEAFGGRLFRIARVLARGAEERTRAGGRRLREYRDSALPALTQWLFSPAPVHGELEVFHLTHSLERMRELLGPDDPLVRRVLGRESPAELAARLVRGTRLSEVAVRRALWEGGRAAVAAAAREDPMLALALDVDGDARAVRRRYEDEVEAVRRQAEEAL
ncbi:MAG TPA: S46 family peptidase, partial [Anaeromyxobacteraceae bacterium]